MVDTEYEEEGEEIIGDIIVLQADWSELFHSVKVPEGVYPMFNLEEWPDKTVNKNDLLKALNQFKKNSRRILEREVGVNLDKEIDDEDFVWLQEISPKNISWNLK
jgi:hypothetical protein